MERGVRVLSLTVFFGNNPVTLFLFITAILLFGCLSLLNEQELLNDFSKLYPILFQIQSVPDVLATGKMELCLLLESE
jgi:hypothetical protein